MDEIRLFEGLRPPPPPDAPRMREAARARLTAATSIPSAPPARRRSTAVTVAAAAALVASGTAYGLTAAQGGPASPRAGTNAGRDRGRPATVAGPTAVHGCPGKYITAGTLERVSGTRLILQPANDRDHVNRTWRAQPVTVATSSSTVITRPASGTASDITDGSQVVVQGTWSGGRLAATQVGIETALPAPPSFGPPVRGQRLRKLVPRGFMPKGATGTSGPAGQPALGPPIMGGRVADAHDGSFTLVVNSPLLGAQRIQVITSPSTKVVSKASASLGQLRLGANVVAVGEMGPHGMLTASTVAEPSAAMIILAGGPVRIRASGCSASAITTAALLAGG